MASNLRPIKSLLISKADFPPEKGGISRLMGALISSLSADEICCLTAVPRDSVNPRRSEGNPKPRIYRRPAAFAKRRHVQTLGFGLTISEIMLRERPRVVQLSTVYEGYIGLWLHQWFRLPFLVFAHGNEIYNALKSAWPKPRQALTRAARVLAVSGFTAELVRKAQVDPLRIAVVHPGCDINRFVPRAPQTDFRQKLLGAGWENRVVLSVGRLVSRKGHDMVVRALPRLVKKIPNLTYLIVGDGPCRAALEDLASALGVRPHLTFLGHIPDELLPEVYALADVFVMPSREEPDFCEVEGFGLVYLEANACGKPVVAGRSGGIGDAVVDGVTGLLVDPLDPQDIANRLGQILESSEIARRLGQQGRERVLREFTWAHFADRIRNIVGEVVEAGCGEAA